MDIYYDLTRQCRVDISGTRTTAKPKIRFREQPEWKIHFVDERNAAVGMGHVASWRAAVDRDFSSSTAPMCRTLDSSIDKSGAALGIVTVPINANTSSAKAAIDGQRSINAYFELWGLDASGNPAVYLEIDVAFEGVVDPDLGDPPAEIVSGLASKSEIAAIVNGHAVLSRLSVNASGQLCLDGRAIGGTTDSGGDDPDPTPSTDKMYYGYIDTATAGGMTAITQITSAMLSASGLTEATPAVMDKTGVSGVPEAAWLTVLLPAASNLKARKFDGLTGPTEFELNNGAAGTGSNGGSVTLDGTAYKVYAEFCLVGGEYFIYVEQA